MLAREPACAAAPAAALTPQDHQRRLALLWLIAGRARRASAAAGTGVRAGEGLVARRPSRNLRTIGMPYGYFPCLTQVSSEIL